MHLLDIVAWLRMGRPARGEISHCRKGHYTFEEGAEVPRRLASVFGDLSRLSAADLGCGPSETAVGSQMLRISWRRLISVEAFPPYVVKLHEKKADAQRHDVFGGRIEHFFDEFAPGEFDVALMIDVLEHFPRREALALLARVERHFNVGAVVFSPLGHIPQEPYDDNPLQEHRSFWTAREFARLGYDVTVCEAFHGFLDPPADAAWAIKRWG